MSDPVAAPIPLKLVPRREIFPLTAAREAELRQRVIWEAMSWIGTPYRQLGATKGVGVDCAMLLVRAVVDAGIVEPFDPRPYPPLWFHHRDDERYTDWLETMAQPVAAGRPGDVIAIRFGRAFAHSGFLVDDAHIVHAFAEDGVCCVTPLHNATLLYMDRAGKAMRPRRYFDFFARLRAYPANRNET